MVRPTPWLPPPHARTVIQAPIGRILLVVLTPLLPPASSRPPVPDRHVRSRPDTHTAAASVANPRMQHGGGSNANAEVKRTRLGNKGQYQGIRDVAQALRGTGGTRGQGALPRVRACPGVYSHCRHDLRNSSAIRALQRRGVQGALPRGTRAPRCLHTLQARLGGVLAQSALHRGNAGTGQQCNSELLGTSTPVRRGGRR